MDELPGADAAQVRQRKAEGADVIKIFASASIRDGGTQTLSDEQLKALCGEAKAQGMRTMSSEAMALVAGDVTTIDEVIHNVYIS